MGLLLGPMYLHASLWLPFHQDTIPLTENTVDKVTGPGYYPRDRMLFRYNEIHGRPSLLSVICSGVVTNTIG